MVGFFVGRESKSVDIIREDTVIELENTRDLYHTEEVKEVVPQAKDNSTEAKALTRQERRENFEKTLEKYMNAAPYGLVQKLYYKRSSNTDDVAFSGPYEKGDWESEQRKEIEQTIFERTLPIIKQGFFYVAQGTFSFANKDLPYEILLSFQEFPSKEELKGKPPSKPKDLSYSIIFSLDVSELDPKKGRVFNNLGGGMFYLYNDGGRTFIRSENYTLDTTSEIRNLLYYLIEAPNSEELPGVIRVFNVQTSQWSEVTDQLQWRRLTKNEYFEAKEAIFNN